MNHRKHGIFTLAPTTHTLDRIILLNVCFYGRTALKFEMRSMKKFRGYFFKKTTFGFEKGHN